MTAPPRVVLTGLGTVGAAGAGAGELARQLHESRVELSEVERTPSFHRAGGARLAALVDDAELRPWLHPMAARRMSRPSKLAVAAARIALEDASLDPKEVAAHSAPVSIATAFGPTEFSERIVRGILEEGPEGTSPALFTESVANAPAAQVALSFGADGPNVTVTQREAGPLIALAGVAREVRSGRAQVGLAGAVDEVNPLLHALLDHFGALASDSSGEGEVARPFDVRRNGFHLAEGATVLVLESEANARRRGVRPWAAIRGSFSGFDPQATAASWSGNPEVLAATLGHGLARLGVRPTELDRIVSGASGARQGDHLEAGVLRLLCGEEGLPPVLAPKGVVGEYGGGFLAAAVLAAAGSRFGPTAGFETTDPEIGLSPHDGRELDPPERLLVSSLAAGGAAAWAVLELGDRK